MMNSFLFANFLSLRLWYALPLVVAVSLVYAAAEVSSSRPSRISYLIDGNGQIKKVYESVTPADHPGEVLKDLS